MDIKQDEKDVYLRLRNKFTKLYMSLDYQDKSNKSNKSISPDEQQKLLRKCIRTVFYDMIPVLTKRAELENIDMWIKNGDYKFVADRISKVGKFMDGDTLEQISYMLVEKIPIENQVLDQESVMSILSDIFKKGTEHQIDYTDLFILACNNGYQKIAKLVYEKNKLGNVELDKVISNAIRYSNSDVLKYLLSIDKSQKYKLASLQYAVMYESTKTLNYLFNNFGYTASEIASVMHNTNSSEIKEYLTNKIKDLNGKKYDPELKMYIPVKKSNRKE